MTCCIDNKPTIYVFGEFVQPKLFDDLVQSKMVSFSMGDKPTERGRKESDNISEIYKTNVKLFHPEDYPPNQLEILVTALKNKSLEEQECEMEDRLIFRLDRKAVRQFRIPVMDQFKPEKHWTFRINKRGDGCESAGGKALSNGLIGRYYHSFVGIEKYLQDSLGKYCGYYKIQPQLTLESEEVTIFVEQQQQQQQQQQVQEISLDYLRQLDPEAVGPYDAETETDEEDADEAEPLIIELAVEPEQIGAEESVAKKMQRLVNRAYDQEFAISDRLKSLQDLFQLDPDGDVVYQVCYWLVRLDETPIEQFKDILDKSKDKVVKTGEVANRGVEMGILLAAAMQYMNKLLNRDLKRFYPKIEAWIDYGQNKEPAANGERLMTFLLSCRAYYENLYKHETILEEKGSTEHSVVADLLRPASIDPPCTFCDEPNAPYYYDYIASHACQKCHETDAKTTQSRLSGVVR